MGDFGERTKFQVSVMLLYEENLISLSCLRDNDSNGGLRI
jgi:hypothetical protein